MQRIRALHGKMNKTRRLPATYGATPVPTDEAVAEARWLLDSEHEQGTWALSRRPVLFEAFLVTLGASISVSVKEHGAQGYATGERFHFRYTADKVEVGARDTFDRWANSVDFYCSPAPNSELQCKGLLAALDEAQTRNVRFGLPCWEPLDLYPLMRKHRTHLRAQLRGRI